MIVLKDSEFKLLQEYISKNYGIHLNDDKKSLVFSRLRTLLIKYNLNSFEEFYDYLVNDKTGDISREFINRISTNHTFFMRESEHFKFLEEEVLPIIEKKYENEKDIRLWSAGCSSGEEPYTIQIILNEYFENKNWDTKILATDVSTKVLTMAYQGRYSKDSLSTMPKEWINKYFHKYDDDYMEINDILKKEIIFRKVNLNSDNLESKFTKKFQIIFCRNVMIYFSEEARIQLVNKFYNMLEDGGYLFIGHSESLNYTKTDFKYIKPAVYQKI